MTDSERSIVRELVENPEQRIAPPPRRQRRFRFTEPTQYRGRMICAGTLHNLVRAGYLEMSGLDDGGVRSWGATQRAIDEFSRHNRRQHD